MSIFDSIKNAIFGHAASAAPPGASASAPSGVAAGTAPGTSANVSAAPTAAPSGSVPAARGAAISSQTLNAQLTQMGAKSGQTLNWQTSIVDLMKLVGLDPSLANRKQLAQELGYHGDANDSASMNVWLHQEVMQKLAQSGGQVPSDLKR